MQTAIVRHKITNVIYRHLEGNKFRNIATNVEGEVPDEVAKKIFAINPDATHLCNEYPNIEKLIAALNLKVEITSPNKQLE